MNPLKKYLQSLRQHASPKTRALEQELDAVREAHATAIADLAKAQEDLLRAREADAQVLAGLQQQLRQIESEHALAREQSEHMESSLADTEQRQKSTEEQMSSLLTRLDEGLSSARDQVTHMQHVLADAEQRQKSMEGRVDSLETRFKEEVSYARDQVADVQGLLADTDQHRKSTEGRVDSLERRLKAEISNAHDTVAHVQRVLADAEQRQKSAEAHVDSLESRLGEERSRHEESLLAANASLARIQDEQQSLLTQQSGLTSSFQGIETRLQDLQQVDNAKPQQSRLMFAVIAGVLLATGAMAGVFIMQNLQDRSQELAMVEQDIHDMRDFMKERIDNQDAALNELALALNRQAIVAQDLAGEALPTRATEMQEADEQPSKSETFIPDIRELQAGLITLGYDLGIQKPNGELGVKTRQALQEFRQFYLTDSGAQDDLTSEPLVAQILKSADTARADAVRFNIRHDVLAAIRLGSIRTGVDFSFLMELARVESNFNPVARAPLSSATGLFQFKDHAWLEAIRTFGADYGLQDYAKQVKLVDDGEYEQERIVRDPLQLEVLALRLNPRLSSLMMAENIKRNLQILSDKIGHEPGPADLYLAHFLGPDNAVLFLGKLDEEPAVIAADLFPQAAESNPVVFLNHRHQPRTVVDVYRRFERKFNTARYDERNPG